MGGLGCYHDDDFDLVLSFTQRKCFNSAKVRSFVSVHSNERKIILEILSMVGRSLIAIIRFVCLLTNSINYEIFPFMIHGFKRAAKSFEYATSLIKRARINSAQTVTNKSSNIFNSERNFI